MYERQVPVTYTRPQAGAIQKILRIIANDRELLRQFGFDRRVDLDVVERALDRTGEAIKKRDEAMNDKVASNDWGQPKNLNPEEGLDRSLKNLDRADFPNHETFVKEHLGDLATSTNPALLNTEGNRPHNKHCIKCKDTRGGPLGHTTEECRWDGSVEAPLDFLEGFDV